MEKIKLFCLPYAGGSAMLYTKWKKLLHPSIELCPVELAGRGKRFKDAFYDTLDAAFDDVYRLIKPEIYKGPYALFGHSMGASIVFEVCHKIKKAGDPSPAHVFISGRKPPHLKPDDSHIHNLPEEEFKEEIAKLGGTSPEVMANQELLDIFLPVLRADYRVLETHHFAEKVEKLAYDVSILHGMEDEATVDEVAEWQNYMAKQCKFYNYEGDHFFINVLTKEIVDMINQTLVGVSRE